jgi:hypothetical protein
MTHTCIEKYRYALYKPPSRSSFLITTLAVLLNFQFIPNQLLASCGNWPVGARQAAMCNTGLTIPDVWSNFHNQAGLAYINDLTIGLYHENKYMVKEYALHSIAVALPTHPGTFGLSYSYFGYTKYSESKLGLAFSKRLGENIAGGLQMDYMHTYIGDGYGTTGAFTFECGIIVKPTENLSIGAHLFNAARQTIKSGELSEKIPTIFRLGLGYKFGDKGLASLETEKYLDDRPIYKASMEYKILQSLYARFGVSNGYTKYAIGFGYATKRMKADIAFSQHPVLGFTPHLGLTYEFK